MSQKSSEKDNIIIKAKAMADELIHKINSNNQVNETNKLQPEESISHVFIEYSNLPYSYQKDINMALYELQSDINRNLSDFMILMAICYKATRKTYNENYLQLSIRYYPLKKIITQQYIYHITDRKKRYSILKNGLTPGSFERKNYPDLTYPEGVYGNNSSDFSSFFPVDEWLYIPANNEHFDVWEIDTTIYKGIWYRDFNFHFDSVFTFDRIPSSALELYNINQKNILTPEKTLIHGLTLRNCIYHINKYNGNEIELPDDISWPILPEEFREYYHLLDRDKKQELNYIHYINKTNRNKISSIRLLTDW